MFKGALFVILACLCWGLVFVIPKLIVGFGPIEISLGRFFCYGLVSAALLLIKKRSLFARTYAFAWKKALWLAFISTLISYTSLVFAVHYAQPAAAALIFGMSPITIALYGNWVKKEHDNKQFFLPGLLMLSGIALTNLNAFAFEGSSLGLYLIGLFCAFLSLATWTWYTIANFHFLGKNKEIVPGDWVIMQGVATLALVLFSSLALAFFHLDVDKYFTFTPELKTFFIGSLVLGTLSSWVAFYFWSCGNLRLPISLASQLTIFEMIFGLFFSYLAEKRWPLPSEAAGIALMLVGVLVAFKTLKKLTA
jgi:drug/metabolite transporter (DMT)-like permease